MDWQSRRIEHVPLLKKTNVRASCCLVPSASISCNFQTEAEVQSFFPLVQLLNVILKELFNCTGQTQHVYKLNSVHRSPVCNHYFKGDFSKSNDPGVKYKNE